MAAATCLPAMNAENSKSLHPFFTRPAVQKPGDGPSAVTNEVDLTSESNEDCQQPRAKLTKVPKKQDDEQARQSKQQKTLSEIVNPRAPEQTTDTDEEVKDDDIELNAGRRKRRRTADDAFTEMGTGGRQEDDGSACYQTPIENRDSTPQVLVPASSPLPTVKPRNEEESMVRDPAILAPQTPPKKILRLNASGKFSSPPSKKPKDQEGSDVAPEQPRRRGRPRKSAKPVPKALLLVAISYGKDALTRKDLGHKIDRILSGDEVVQVVASVAAKTKAKTTSKRKTPQKPGKSLHPFFGGKQQEGSQRQHVKTSPRKTSAVTPGKLRMQAQSDQIQGTKDIPFTSALLKDRLISRCPGAKDPPFPDKEQAHVRGLESIRDVLSLPHMNTCTARRKRKCLEQLSLEPDSILSLFWAQIIPDTQGMLRKDGFREPNPTLHVPNRLLLSGIEIAKRVANELSVDLSQVEEDELSSSGTSRPHPALWMLYQRIPTTITAYDECRGETMPWVQKYAPESAHTVLQPQKEMNVLRDWLKSLSLQAVVGAVTVTDKPTAPKTAEKVKKKKRKKGNDLDDFLVDSDDEIHEMSELVGDDICSASTRMQKSVVQVANGGGKLSNAVLLSGPSGCGKTAAAYAVAKELGFKVFEISSSERRSGRDVLLKVGDMTENHLVKHHGTEDLAALSSTEDNGRIDDAFQKDLVSGKQGKMVAFFKPEAPSKPAQTKKIENAAKLKIVQEALKKPAREQQQSLILLEEVDILFKEDKDFWNTVLKLITTSKRPFIMTCNDEDLVPLQILNLHACLRFSQPSFSLAIDYMLLVAAAEGHLLDREAVAALYEKQDHDLRSSIAKLDYWCQMGVGDPRGGLTWIYQRWPPGSDLDEQGRKLRVISEGTFQASMCGSSTSGHIEDGLCELMHDRDLHPATALGWDTMQKLYDSATRDEVERNSLGRYANLAESLSAADVGSALCFAENAPLDATQPDLPEKFRANYIEGMQLMQTDEAIDYLRTSEQLLVSQLVATSQIWPEFGLCSNITQEAVPRQPDDLLSRHAFACFDAIAQPAEGTVPQPALHQSAFDGTLRTITEDLAPYVRSIVQYDQALEEQRERLNLLTSNAAPGRRAKRARTTRAARSALEGGQRGSTRRERWFDHALDMDAVLATGGKDWPRFVSAPESIDESLSRGEVDGTETPAASLDDDEIKYE